MAKQKKKQSNKIFTFIVFILFALFILGGYFFRNFYKGNEEFVPGDELNVIALEMHGTYGDSFIIKYNNFEILVDAGTTQDKKYVQDALEEYVTDDELDILMVSHLHADHIGDMTSTSFFEDVNINVLKIVDAGTAPTSKTSENYVQMRNDFVNKGATYIPYYDILNNDEIGTVWNIDKEQNIYIEFFDTGKVVKPGEIASELNETSIAFTLCYNQNKWFFGGDLPDSCENDLVNSMKESSLNYFKEEDHVVYKTCHHGSKTSNGDTLLSYVKPDIIFSMSGIVSKNQTKDPITDQHPYLETLERMKKYTDKIYWTSINGTIILSSKGSEVTLLFKGRTVDYYYNGEIVSKENEKEITIFESKWYQAISK